MNVLFIGDIFGTTGLRAVETELADLKKEYNVDFTIANAENTTKCRGLNIFDYQRLIDAGVDLITMGNHTWKQRDILTILQENKNIIRPLNISLNENLSKYGLGTIVVNLNNKKIRVTNLLGSTLHFNLARIDNPFISLEDLVSIDKSDIHIIDFHSETTSEKNCLLRSFASRVSAILGTHTHVQTNDATNWKNTLYISDVGMTGPSEGIIGAKIESIKSMFYGESDRFLLEEAVGKYQFCAVLMTFDDSTNKPLAISNIYIREK